MGQTYTDYEKASTEAAHKAHQTLHAFEELVASSKSGLFQEHNLELTLTAKGIDRKSRPLAPKSEDLSLTVEEQATSGNLTAFIRMRKLAEASPVKNEKGELPFPFSNPAIIPPVLANLLAELNTMWSWNKERADKLLHSSDPSVWKHEYGPRNCTLVLSDAEAEAIASGKLQALTFDGFLKKKLRKRYVGVMGSGFLALNVWNDSYSANKWVLHIHSNGKIVAEHLEVTNYIKRDHL